MRGGMIGQITLAIDLGIPPGIEYRVGIGVIGIIDLVADAP